LKAVTIMSLESILHDLEQGRGPARDPELYFFSVFGEPNERGTWGWRVEGHHLSLNFVVKDGMVASATPAFFGANPAEAKTGPRAGVRTLAEEEDLARQLVQMLDADGKKAAVMGEEVPRDIRGANTPQPPNDGPVGLAAAKMTDRQRSVLLMLVGEYANNLPQDVATALVEEIERAGTDKIHFAWTGATERGTPHYYRVQGPTFLIEYINAQNDANHIHSVWRNVLGDFAVPLSG
jgi:hypothetical protein